MKKKVLVAMSGGVDSSVAAYLLKQQGYDVIGATMQIWPSQSDNDTACCSLSAVDDARRIANKLDIPYYVFNFKDIFQKEVIEYFIEEYEAGRTPNPCIACNRYIKFEHLLKKAQAMGIEYIATGHYAKIEKRGERYILKRSKDKGKDQTYVLYNLTQEQLKYTLFPLGEYKKSRIRKIAKELDVRVSNKPDSQEICFVEDNDYAKFISENSDREYPEGEILDINENRLGTHKGIHKYTIGQRKGIGISAKEPLFVVDIDPFRNTITVGSKEDIFSRELVAEDINLVSIEKLEKPMKVKAKIRYGTTESGATISPMDDGNILVRFDKDQRAITSGQSVVFYKRDILVGGGIIR